MTKTAKNGQVMVEYLLVCGVIVAILIAPVMSHNDSKDGQRISVGQLLVNTTQNNLNAWHFGTRIAD